MGTNPPAVHIIPQRATVLEAPYEGSFPNTTHITNMDFADVHARTGCRLSYWGTIGTQRLLPFGTPEEVRATVRRNLDICGESGGNRADANGQHPRH